MAERGSVTIDEIDLTGDSDMDTDCAGPVSTEMDLDQSTEEAPDIQSMKEEAEKCKASGNASYGKKKYDKASEFYSKAIELDPNCSAYYANRSACYMMLHRYREARNDAQKCVDLDPTYVKGCIRLAKCCIAFGDIIQAEQALANAEHHDPQNESVSLEKQNIKYLRSLIADGEKYLEQKDYRRVVYLMDRALDRACAALKFKLQKAECLAYLGKYSDAYGIATDILQIHDNDIDAIYVRGLCLYYEDNVAKAFQHFNRVLSLDPDNMKTKDIYKKAKLLKRKKEDGNTAFNKGKYQEALILYTEALGVDPNNKATNSKLYCNRAAALSKLKKFDEAADDCTTAIRLDENYLKAYIRRAQCYMDLQQYEEAVRDYEKLLKLQNTKENKNLLHQAKVALKRSKRKDYYKILDIHRSASLDEIKRAYKKKALVHHPDRHSNSSEAEQKEQEKKFKELGEAYSILSDPKKKSRYDNGHDLEDLEGCGDIDPSGLFSAFFGGQGTSCGFGGFPGSDFSGNFHQFGGNMPNGFTFQFR